MANAAQQPLVALLGRDDGARAQLRSALVELGAQVVVEAEPSAARATQVLDAGTNTVVVNLAAGMDEDIDHLQELFDSPQVNVVFNDAEVSGSLEGWDLARWARHLAAKVLGHDNTLPPPPNGALPLAPDMSAELRPGAPPKPEHQTAARAIEEFVVEAEFRVDDVPENHLPLDNSSSAATTTEEEFTIDFDLASLESALQADNVASSKESAPEVTTSSESGLDFGDFEISFAQEAAESAPAATAAPESTEEEVIDLPDIGEIDSLGLPDDSAAPQQAPAGTATTASGDADFSFDLDSLSLDSITFEEDATRTAAQAPSVSLNFSDGSDFDESNLLDDEVAALAASLEAMESALPETPVVDDFSLSLNDSDIDLSDSAEPAATAPKRTESSFGSLSLAGLDDDAPAAPTTPAQKSAAPSFDLDNLSLVSLDDESPAAPPEPAAKPAAFDVNQLGSGLSLAPIEGEDGGEVDPLMVAMGLVEAPSSSAAKADGASSELRRVVVLGASIGGPDAVRTFLSAIPEGFPAAFLLAQHLENGYFERLAQQLQKSVKMPVSVLGAAKVEQGQVYVVPANARFSIAADGTVTANAHETPPRYTPSIDNLFVEVAQRFGSRTTAIVFSGMAGDAIEGSAKVTAAGGEVWVQDPASCVVSSMVDGAKARGVVEFTGSPRELAEQLIARYGKA